MKLVFQSLIISLVLVNCGQGRKKAIPYLQCMPDEEKT
jgi:hypothetical protein